VDGTDGLTQVLTTFAAREDALTVARAAVDARVAACVQIIGPITSVYRWQGRIEEAEEYLCLFKAPGEAVEQLASFIRDRHPYDTPELTAVPSSWVDERYAEWARAETINQESTSGG